MSRVATLFQITYLGVGELGGLQRGHVAPQPELLHLQPLEVLLPLADLALHSDRFLPLKFFVDQSASIADNAFNNRPLDPSYLLHFLNLNT